MSKLAILRKSLYNRFIGQRVWPRYRIAPSPGNQWANISSRPRPAVALNIVGLFSILFIVIWYAVLTPTLTSIEHDPRVTSESLGLWKLVVGLVPLLYYLLLTIVFLYLAVDAFLLLRSEMKLLSDYIYLKDLREIAPIAARQLLHRRLAYAAIFVLLLSLLAFTAYSTFCALDKHSAGFSTGWVIFNESKGVFVFDPYRDAISYTLPAIVFGLASFLLITTDHLKSHIFLAPHGENAQVRTATPAGTPIPPSKLSEN